MTRRSGDRARAWVIAAFLALMGLMTWVTCWNNPAVEDVSAVEIQPAA